MSKNILTIEQQRIISQIESGFGFYGGKYKNATTKEQKELIVKTALCN